MFLITIYIISNLFITNALLFNPYVGFGYNPIVSPFYAYGYGLANALGLGLDNFSYFGKPMYNSYSIGYPYMNNFGYSMGSGYGTGFPPINFGFGHPGLSYGPGYGMNYGPSIGGYNWFNKKDFHDYHFHGIGNGIHIGGGSFDDYHRSKRYGHEAADISPAASITAPTSMFMNKQKSLSSKQQLPLHSQYLINENN